MESKTEIQNRKRKAQGELVGYQCFNGQVRVLLHTGNTKSMSTSLEPVSVALYLYVGPRSCQRKG